MGEEEEEASQTVANFNVEPAPRRLFDDNDDAGATGETALKRRRTFGLFLAELMVTQADDAMCTVWWGGWVHKSGTRFRNDDVATGERLRRR